MTTETPTRRRRSMLFEPDAELLIPRDTTNLPPPIAEENEKAWLKFEAWIDAGRRASEAEQIAQAAPRHDELALEAALSADEKAPKQTTPAKQVKAEAARREKTAAETIAKQAILSLWDAVERHYPEYLAGREAAYAAVATRPREILEELARTWAALEAEAAMLALARRWHNNVRSAALSNTGRGQRNRKDKARAELDAHRMHRKTVTVPDTFEHLIVALERQVEEAPNLSVGPERAVTAKKNRPGKTEAKRKNSLRSTVRVCPVCGDSFRPRSWNQRYCTGFRGQCYRRAMNVAYRGGELDAPLPEPFSCARCGKACRPGSNVAPHARKFCGQVCKRKHHREKERQPRRATR